MQELTRGLSDFTFPRGSPPEQKWNLYDAVKDKKLVVMVVVVVVMMVVVMVVVAVMVVVVVIT